MKPLLIPLIVLLCEALPPAFADSPSPRDTQSDTWVGTDALNRRLPGFAECGPLKSDKVVGIFYFLWMQKTAHGHVYDIPRILQQNSASPAWGPIGAFHWWSEPRLGYYLSDDEFVIRRHAQMLSDAGVDVLIFDVTNANTYDATLDAVCKTFAQIRHEGGHTPQITFIAHSSADRVVRHLYDSFYTKNLYPELWFRWKGKPLMISSAAKLDPETLSFFTLRESWAFSDDKRWFGDGRDKWAWIDHTPQNFGWHDSKSKPEQISVSVAEHPISNVGRSFSHGKQPPTSELRTDQGLHFAEQWDRALKVSPEFVFVTGWNEWMAQRFITRGVHMSLVGRPLNAGDSFFVDEYNQEFSRDIEPMRGGHGDNYYYQLTANIRRYKGVREPPRASPAKTIRINADFSQWNGIKPEYLDDLFDTTHRSHPGYGDSGPYVNDSGRNDLDRMKVSRDDKNLYFYVRTREPITAPQGESWMLLLLNTDCNHVTGWEGYDFLINRNRTDANTCSIERNTGGWTWQKVADAKLERVGNELHIAVPRNALGSEKNPLRFDFKWADNIPVPPNIADFIDQGDVAPNGRFSYRYQP